MSETTSLASVAGAPPPPQYFCHLCAERIDAVVLADLSLRCPMCSDCFVELIEQDDDPVAFADAAAPSRDAEDEEKEMPAPQQAPPQPQWVRLGPVWTLWLFSGLGCGRRPGICMCGMCSFLSCHHSLPPSIHPSQRWTQGPFGATANISFSASSSSSPSGGAPDLSQMINSAFSAIMGGRAGPMRAGAGVGVGGVPPAAAARPFFGQPAGQPAGGQPGWVCRCTDPCPRSSVDRSVCSYPSSIGLLTCVDRSADVCLCRSVS